MRYCVVMGCTIYRHLERTVLHLFIDSVKPVRDRATLKFLKKKKMGETNSERFLRIAHEYGSWKNLLQHIRPPDRMELWHSELISSLPNPMLWVLIRILLTLSQTTNFRLFQTERVFR